jgi:hypothetical protein
VNEERILDKLDGLEAKTTEVLVAVVRVEEQVKDLPSLRERVSALEKWRWSAVGALAASGAALGSQLLGVLKGN